MNVSASMDEKKENNVRKVCPSPKDLSVVLNDLRCENCNLHFKNLARYHMHNDKVHKMKYMIRSKEEKDKNIQYHCPVTDCIYAIDCDRFFTQKRYLKQHYLKIHAERKYPCTLCPKSFSTEAAKDAHVKVCGVLFDCIVCKKSYNSYEALLTHAKRNSHEVDPKYKKNRQSKVKKKAGINSVRIPQLRTNEQVSGLINSPLIFAITILPKMTQNIAVQTETTGESPTKDVQMTKNKSEVCQETQTNCAQKAETFQNSKETQTGNATRKIVKIAPKISRIEQLKTGTIIINKEMNLADNFAPENLFPSSPLPLRHDVALPELWEDKSTSGTQTSPEKDPFLNDEFCEEVNSNMVNDYNFSKANTITKADPMLTESEFTDRFINIETQTEQAYCQSLFDSDSLSRTFSNENQRAESFNIEPLQLYNNSCTQTCDEILPSDLGLSNIQTQTAWSHFVDTTVSTETQTKNFPCQSGCEDSNHDCRSWLSIQTNHMETQTDILSMLEQLD